MVVEFAILIHFPELPATAGEEAHAVITSQSHVHQLKESHFLKAYQILYESADRKDPD